VAGSATAQLAYQSTVSGQNPNYYFQFDNSWSSVGNTVSFTPANNATFGNDYWNNASSAALFPTAGSAASANDDASISSSIISGAGTTTAVGSLSLLFYVPSAIPATGYYFSDGDATSGSYFAFAFGSSALNLKVGNKTFTPASTPSFAGGVTVTHSTWYYLALTWDLGGTVAGVNGVGWNVGQVGGSLVSGFLQKGGTGNISTTSTLGQGGTMYIDAKTAGTSGVQGGEIDELATWNSVLSGSDISAQFNALAVPEPSSVALIGGGTLILLCFLRRKIGAHLQG
jgi:hypothetical protein